MASQDSVSFGFNRGSDHFQFGEGFVVQLISLFQGWQLPFTITVNRFYAIWLSYKRSQQAVNLTKSGGSAESISRFHVHPPIAIALVRQIQRFSFVRSPNLNTSPDSHITELRLQLKHP